LATWCRPIFLSSSQLIHSAPWITPRSIAGTISPPGMVTTATPSLP